MFTDTIKDLIDIQNKLQRMTNEIHGGALKNKVRLVTYYIARTIHDIQLTGLPPVAIQRKELKNDKRKRS